MKDEQAAALELRTFGGIEIRHFSRTVNLRDRKATALLFYLAVERNQRHSRESLLGLLWPEMRDADARNNLRVVVTRLRQKLKAAAGAPPYLASNRHQLWFQDDGRATSDFWTFHELLAHRRTHDEQRACADCRQRLAQAAALYQGEFLAGFNIGNCPAFDEWLYVWRERLHLQANSLLAELTAINEAQGDLDAAIMNARRQIELDPLQEQAHRNVMRLLFHQNQRAQALVQFEELRQILQDNLGVGPDGETMALWQEIKGGSHVYTAAGQPQSGTHNLPESTTPFIGREEELNQISSRLAKGGYRLLSLVGPGGIGKTRLAVEAARANQIRFTDGVYLVPMTPVAHADSIPDAIAKAVGISFGKEQGDPADTLIATLATNQILLLIDNFEHLMAGVGFLLTLLERAPRLTLLVTSRERLNVQSEDLFLLRGLPCPGADEEAEAARYPAVRLFCDRARRLRKGFKLTPKNKPNVVRICRIVQGVPLAIELAATWIRDFTTAELAQALEEKADILVTTMQDIAPEHRSMEMVFDTSWRLLTPAEQALFARLSVFMGGFTREAATEVADATPLTLTRLRYQSLIYTVDSGRFEMHDLLCTFATRILEAEPGASDATRNRHAGYYLAWLARRTPELQSQTPQPALGAIEQELDNLRQAWLRAVNAGCLSLLQESYAGLARFYALSGRQPEGEAMISAALQACDTMINAGGEACAEWQRLHSRLHVTLGDLFKH